MTTGGSDRDTQTLAQIEEAYSEYGGSLLRFALRLCGNREDAEDIVAETFTQAYRKWHTFREDGVRRNWLYGIAVNRYRMSRRRPRIASESLTEEIVAIATHTLDRIALEQEIAKLPLSQREAFLLVKSEGLTAREASEILGRPLGTVLYEVHQAVHTLRRALVGEEAAKTPRLCEAEP